MFGKGALALLNEYGTDSSDDEVPGPRVSTKRVFRDVEECSKKKLKKLPVPREFLDNQKTNSYIDDPSLHNGKIRSFAHERGNWATFVYIPYEAQEGISELLSSLKEILPNHIGMKQSDDFHISLTRTVILKYHWINSFVENIKTNLQSFKRFQILFDKVQVYCNEERTRTFLGIRMRSGHDTLLKLVELLDKCLEEYKLPSFYKDPSFHMSIAWCVGDIEKELQELLPEINNKMNYLMQVRVQDTWSILVECLISKIGNRYFQFMLN